MKTRLLATALLAGLAFQAQAATPINETRPLDARGSIEIENVKGRIEVRTWDKSEVHIGGSLGKGVERFSIEGSGDRLEVQVKYPNNSSGSEPTTLLLKVPTLADLSIDGVAVDIDVVGVAGRELEIDSVSGEVAATGAPESADIQSVSGQVRLNVNSASVDVESVSGDITLRGRLSGDVDAETVSGKIDIDSRDERARRVSTSSVSGDASIDAALADGGKISAESVSGDIRVTLPKSLSARVSGESFSGSLRAPDAQIDKPKYGPGSSFEHTYGQGRGEVRMETFSGDAELRLE